MKYTIIHEQPNLHFYYVGDHSDKWPSGELNHAITPVYPANEKLFISGVMKKIKPTTPVGKSSITRYCMYIRQSTHKNEKIKKASWKV